MLHSAPAVGETRWFLQRDPDMPAGQRFRIQQGRYEGWPSPEDAPRWYMTGEKSHYFGTKKEAEAALRVLRGEG